MAEWTVEELLYFDIAHALRKVKIPGVRKALTEEQRMAIAGTSLNTSNSVAGSSTNHREVAPDWRRASSASLLSHGSMVMN